MISCDKCGFGHKTSEEFDACKSWEEMQAAYKADRINDKLWIVKRFKGHATVPENFNNADYDECQVRIYTDLPAEAIKAAIEQESWS